MPASFAAAMLVLLAAASALYCQVLVNQSGYNTIGSKRFTAPLAADGTPFSIVTEPGGNLVFSGVVTGASGDLETITLTETGADTAVFQGLLFLENTATPASGDGSLQATAGSTLTVSYAYDIFARSATATAADTSEADLAITTSGLAPASSGLPYSQSLQATGGLGAVASNRPTRSQPPIGANSMCSPRRPFPLMTPASQSPAPSLSDRKAAASSACERKAKPRRNSHSNADRR